LVRWLVSYLVSLPVGTQIKQTRNSAASSWRCPDATTLGTSLTEGGEW